MYTEAMELQINRFGETSAEVARSLNVIGLIYDQKGHTVNAVKKLDLALAMRRNILGEDHLDVAATLTHLGTVRYRQNNITAAKELFAKSLKI